MTEFSLAKLVVESGLRMSSELRSKLLSHRGEIGTAREKIVAEFLRAHLPAGFEVDRGFVFDMHGNLSEQLDVVVADACLTPRFETPGGVRLFPCETVVAVGQVKTRCDSRRSAWGAFSNLRSASVLDRSANGGALCSRTGTSIDHVRDHLGRIFTFLFVIDDALSAESMRWILRDFIERTECHTWPNIVLAIDRYLVTYCCDDGICPNTEHARGVSVLDVQNRNDVLMQFYLMLAQAVSATKVARLSLYDHLRDATQMRGDVTYAAAGDDPPPFLQTLTTLPFEFPELDDADAGSDDADAT